MRFLIFPILLVLFAFNTANAQSDIIFSVKTVNYATGKKESGVSVKVTSGGSTVQNVITDGSGEVKLKVPAGKKYKVEVSKSGKVSRFVDLNLSNVNPELLVGNASPFGSVQISLFDQVPNVDFSYVTSNAITEFYFDGTNPELQYDEIIAQRMIKKIEKIMKDIEAQKGQSDAQYNAAIKEADGLFTQKKYPEALAAYEKALGFKPAEKYPSDKMLEIDGILKAQKATGAAAAKTEEDYQALIASANTLRDQKKYEEAIARYKEALGKKSEQGPKDQIAFCEAEIEKQKKDAETAQKYNEAIKAADGFMGQKSFQAAKDKYKEAIKIRPGDQYATGKLADLEGKLAAQKADQDKKAKYDAAVTAGDALIAEKKWAEAKAKFTEALTIEAAATYPKDKIKELDVKIAEVEKEKQKQDQIARLLADGNTAFTASQWAASKTKYQEALKLESTNKTAIDRIAEIEILLTNEKEEAAKLAKIKQLVTEGDALAKQTKLEDAKAKYVEAIGMKPDPAIKAKIDAIDAQIAGAAQKAEQKAKYDKAMADAELAFTGAKWDEAKAGFQAAATIDPAQALPKQRIAEVDKQIAAASAAAQKNEKFTAAMAAGNAAMTANKLPEAKTKFQEAVTLDGTKPEAKEKLAQVEKLLAEQAKNEQNQAKYDAAIKAGNDLQAANKLPEAKAKFQEAGTLDPAQPLPGQKIAEIDQLIAKAEKQKQVDQVLKEATAAFDKKDLETAKTKYQQVVTLDPSNTIAPAKLQEIAKIESDKAGAAQREAEQKAKYDKAMADGELAFNAKKWDDAKAKFQEAATLNPAQVLPKQRIAEVDKQIAAETANAQKEEKYNAALSAGTAAMAANKLPEARTKFQEAVTLDGTKPEAKDKLAQVEKLLADQAKNQQNQAKYDAAIKAGNDLQAASKLPEAKAKFQEAGTIDPAQALPGQKIAEIDQLIAKAEKQKQVDLTLKEAAAAFDKKDLTTAKTKYQQVLTLDATNTVAPAKLQEIAKLEDDKAGAAQREAEQKAKYDKAMADGELAFNAKKWDDAKAKFQEAMLVNPSQPLPKQRIAEVDKQIAAEAANAQKGEKYTSAMSAGNAALTAGQLPEAKAKFQEAVTLDGTKPEAKEKLAQVEKMLAEQAKNQQSQAKYDAAFKAGNDLLAGNKLPEAKAKFQEAITLDGTKQAAKDKLAEVEKLLADQAKNQQNQQNQAKYDAAIKSGNELMAGSKLPEAKSKFQEAATLDPSQSLPSQKIAEIDKLIAGADKQRQIDILLKDAGMAFDKKEYPAAKTKYQQILGLDGSNAIATARLQDIAKMESDLAGESQKEAKFKQLKEEAVSLMGQKKFAEAKQKLLETKSIKPDAQVDQLIKDCDTQLGLLSKAEETDKAYAALIAEAQSLETSKKYDDAIAKYTAALKIKSGEQLPKDRITALNKLKEGNASQAKTDADYAAAMKKGQDAFDVKNYLEAIKFYNQASVLKPSEKEPVDKAAEAQRLENDNSQSTEEAAYNKILDVAQKAMDEKNYIKAKEMYNRALSFRANDPLPKQRLAEIEALIKSGEEAQKKTVAYNKKVAEAEAAAKGGKLEEAITLFEQAKEIKAEETLPAKRIAELRAELDGKNTASQESEKKYQAAIAAATTLENAKEYRKALTKYQEALSVKPKDKIAQDKISEMQQLLDDQEKSKGQAAAIQQLMVKANSLFEGKKWLDAKAVYEKVLGLDPANTFAIEQIKKCDQNEKDKSTVDVETQYKKVIIKANENFDSKNYDKAKELYNRALSFKPNDPYPKKRLAEIDAILNPTPAPPVAAVTVPVSTEPVALELLGTQTDNSLLEGAQKLERAELERKNIRNKKLKKNSEITTDEVGELAGKQKSTTTKSDVALGEIKRESNDVAIAQDQDRLKIVHQIAEEDTKYRNEGLVSDNYKTAEHRDAKGQLVAAAQSTEKEASVLDGGWAANSTEIKSSQDKESESVDNNYKGAYKERLDNDVKYMSVKLVNEKDQGDDSKQRLETEDIVREADKKIKTEDIENHDRTYENLRTVEGQVEKMNTAVRVKDLEESKTPSENREIVVKSEDGILEKKAADNEVLVKKTLDSRKEVEDVDLAVRASVEKSDDDRRENIATLQKTQHEQSEKDRLEYNASLVKSITSDGTLKSEVVKQDKFNGVSGAAIAENVDKIKVINDGQQKDNSETSKVQKTKKLDVKGELSKTERTVELNSSVGMEQGSDNQDVLKVTDKELADAGNTKTLQQVDKNQASRQLLAGIEKKEIVYSDQVANDVGKLYPEGVSQEQFEQADQGGLVNSIITRRIVVKGGHGSIYVRNQTLNGITYSKNGQPSTEIVWQRETQDAQLKRNY